MALYEDDNFIVKRTKRDYVLIRKGKRFTYEHHSHFRTLKGARSVITFFNKGIKPNKRYYVEAIRRVCTEKEFRELRVKRRKDRYYNRSR